ncbi:transmembrane protein, putative, partial (macronuclear) [Tetrahymena thermophila SB210]
FIIKQRVVGQVKYQLLQEKILTMQVEVKSTHLKKYLRIQIWRKTLNLQKRQVIGFKQINQQYSLMKYLTSQKKYTIEICNALYSNFFIITEQKHICLYYLILCKLNIVILIYQFKFYGIYLLFCENNFIKKIKQFVMKENICFKFQMIINLNLHDKYQEQLMKKNYSFVILTNLYFIVFYFIFFNLLIKMKANTQIY